MAIDTSIRAVSTFPHAPAAIAVTADKWRVVELDPRAEHVWTQCKAAADYGLVFFSQPGVDGPTDDLTSSGGDWTLAADAMEFLGATTAATRDRPSIAIGTGPRGPHTGLKPRYLGITSASSITVLVGQLGVAS